MKLLIDTNVILDALMAREPWAASAQALLITVAEEKAEGCITASSFTDLHYLLRKHLRDNEQTRQLLLGLLASVNVLDVNGTDCEKAFELPMRDYEDALLAYRGKRHKADHIVTRDRKHFDGSPVKVISPDEILRKL
ncbi:MAG: PIN domain-containing protein [Peptococcaceae bacterium]|jgi:predicted nucleic acid-binding protein|nr:PIN domain-containing protein [Peptococcaceae bacterium]